MASQMTEHGQQAGPLVKPWTISPRLPLHQKLHPCAFHMRLDKWQFFL